MSKCLLRKITATALLGCAFLASLPALAQGAKVAPQSEELKQLIAKAQKEGQINLVGSSTTWNAPIKELNRRMNEKYGTTIQIRFVAGASMPQIASRLISEAKVGQPAFTDIFYGADSHTARMAETGSFATFPWDRLVEGYQKEMVPFGKGELLVDAAAYVAIYNTKQVKKEDLPRDLDDLLNPKWKGRIMIPIYNNWVEGYLLNVGMDKLSKLEGWVDKIKAQQPAFARYGETTERVASGEFHFALNDGFEDLVELQAKGALIAALPDFPTKRVFYHYVGVPKTAVNPNAAALFSVFMLSPEGQQIFYKHSRLASHLGQGSPMKQILVDLGNPKWPGIDVFLNPRPEIRRLEEKMKTAFGL